MSKTFQLSDVFYTFNEVVSDSKRYLSKQNLSEEEKIIAVLNKFSEIHKHGDRFSGEDDFGNYLDPNYFLINEPINFCSARSIAFASLLTKLGYQADPVALNDHVIVQVSLEKNTFLIDPTVEEWGINYTLAKNSLGTFEDHIEYLESENSIEKMDFYKNFNSEKVQIMPVDSSALDHNPVISLPRLSRVHYLDTLLESSLNKLAYTKNSLEDIKSVVATTYAKPNEKTSYSFFHPISKIEIESNKPTILISWDNGKTELFYGNKMTTENKEFYFYSINVENRWNMDPNASLDYRRTITKFMIDNQESSNINVKIFGLYSEHNFNEFSN